MKRVLIVTISLAVFLASWLRDALLTLFGRGRRPSCTILYYHAVPDDQRARFASQMDALLRVAEPLKADRTDPLEPNRRYVGITFDDGYQSVLSNALPVLKANGIPATVFVAPGLLGQVALADASTTSVADREVMALPDLERLSSHELVTIGSHSLTHPHLTRVERSQAAHEIVESRRVLERLVTRPVRLFAFPYGDCSEDLFQLCRDAGYDRVFTTKPDNTDLRPSRFVCGRVRADPLDWPLEFRLKVVGAYRWLPAAFALKKAIKGTCGRPS
jgi:peptidoglycan/xylan/chitin deacetylase (PgdA/CDA1 family)